MAAWMTSSGAWANCRRQWQAISDRWAVNTPFHLLGLPDPGELDDERIRRESAATAGLTTDGPWHDNPPPSMSAQHKRLIVRLIRAAAIWPHLAEKQLYPLTEHYPHVLARTEGIWHELLKITARPPAQVLAALTAAVEEVLDPSSQQWQIATKVLRQIAERDSPQRDLGTGG